MGPDELDASWPFVGRGDVVERFTELLRGAAERTPGIPAGLALVGAAGVGKTRLALECQAVAVERGWRAARIIGSRAASSVPFGAAAGLLPAGADSNDPATIIRLVHATLTADGPLCLVADDVDLLDGASATLLLQIASSANVIVLVTARVDRAAGSIVTSFWRDGAVARIDLGDLDRGECDELMAHVLGRPLDAPSSEWLYSSSGGNPMFMRELVLGAAAERGLVRHTDGTWLLTPPSVASSRLAEAVEDRMGALDEREQRCLEAVALAEPIGIEVIEAMGFAAEISRLERRHLLNAASDGRRVLLTVGHPLYGEVARARLLPLRERSLRRALAQALERLPKRGPGDAVRIATWYEEAGLPNSAENLIAASREAFAAGDTATAEHFARAAHAADPSTATAIALATVLFTRREGDAADAVLESAWTWPATDDEAYERALLRAKTLLWLQGREVAAQTVLRDAAAHASADLRRRLDALSAELHGCCHLDDVETVVSTASPALGALALAARGDFERAFRLLRQARVGAADVASIDGLEAFLRVEGGWLDDGERLASRVVASTPGSRTLADGWALFALGAVRSFDGDGVTALEDFVNAARHFDRLSDPTPFSLGTSLAVFSLLLSGELARAQQFVERAPDHAFDLIFGDQLDRARAALLAAHGDHAAAADVLRLRAERAGRDGLAFVEQTCLYDLVRLGVADDAERSRVVELDDRLDCPLSRLRRRHAEAAHDGTALSELSSIAERQRMPYWACELAIGALRALNAAGDERASTAQLRRIARLRAEFPRALFLAPAEWRPAETTFQLPEMQRQVAELAAAGLSDREIATRVHLSVRTVSNYLLRVYRLLGISGREELGDALASIAS